MNTVNTNQASIRSSFPDTTAPFRPANNSVFGGSTLWSLGVGYPSDPSPAATEHEPAGSIETQIDMNLAYHDAKSSAPHEVGNHREASIAAEQISQPKATAAPQNTQQNAPASIASTARSPRCELSYLHCCTAASVSLLILSVASFVVPSVSTYPAERSTVQGLGYTAGVISLLTSIATGAFVAYVYPINDCFRN